MNSSLLPPVPSSGLGSPLLLSSPLCSRPSQASVLSGQDFGPADRGGPGPLVEPLRCAPLASSEGS
jgi:hypothetical protein